MNSTESTGTMLFVLKKILKFSALGVLGITALSLVVWVVTLSYEEWQRRPQLVTQLKGISIGDKESDVVFRLGELRLITQTKNEMEESDKSSFNYVSDEHRMGFREKGGTIDIIQYLCKDYDNSELNGIGCGSTGEEIFRRFGKAVSVFCSKALDKKGLRMYGVFEYGTRFGLSKNRVEVLQVASPETFRSSPNWGPCN